MARKKRLTKKERAEMPSLFGYAGKLAVKNKEHKHKNQIKYDRKKRYKFDD